MKSKSFILSLENYDVQDKFLTMETIGLGVCFSDLKQKAILNVNLELNYIRMS